MQILIWSGAALAMAGVVGLVYCIRRVLRAKRAGLTDEDLRAELRRIVTINLAAFGISAIGLILVVSGILLD